MKIAEFTYTKADGSVSQRTLVVAGVPSNKYSGTDISELNEEMQAEYIAELKALHEVQLQQLIELQRKYELQYRYRQFIDANITNLKIEKE